jgi:hypothetical protein
MRFSDDAKDRAVHLNEFSKDDFEYIGSLPAGSSKITMTHIGVNSTQKVNYILF